MTTSVPEHAPRWPEQWAIQAAVEADRIENRLQVAQAARQPGCPDPGPSARAVAHHLAATRAACCRSGPRSRRGLLDRWRGTSVERAYRNLHTAKVFLVDVLPGAEVDALIPEVLTRLAFLCDRGDPRRIQAERSLRSPDIAVRRPALQQAMELSYDGTDDEYTRLRSFRNIIWMTGLVLTVFVAVLVVAVAFAPHALPLCFEGTGADGAARMVCPSGGGRAPTGGDVIIVAGLGALGGVLAALFAIRTMRGTTVPYGLPIALAVLKVPTGMLTAIAGLLFVGGGFAPGFSNLDSQRQILAYALVLGYAQQLLTRFLDDRARQIIDKLPSKDAEARPPHPTVTSPASAAAGHP
jgi:hypothetical protein